MLDGHPLVHIQALFNTTVKYGFQHFMKLLVKAIQSSKVGSIHYAVSNQPSFSFLTDPEERVWMQ